MWVVYCTDENCDFYHGDLSHEEATQLQTEHADQNRNHETCIEDMEEHNETLGDA